MLLAQVCSLIAGPPGSSVSISGLSAATKHKYVCKLVRQAGPKEEAAGLQDVQCGSRRPPVAVASSTTGTAPAPVPNGHSPSRKIVSVGADSTNPSQEFAPLAHQCKDLQGQTNEKLRIDFGKLRQELPTAQQQLQMASLVKGRSENSICILKQRVEELDEKLEFEKRRGSTWKEGAMAVPHLEEEVHSLSENFRSQKLEFSTAIKMLEQQEKSLSSRLQRRMENEKDIVDSLVEPERAKVDAKWKESQQIEVRAQLIYFLI